MANSPQATQKNKTALAGAAARQANKGALAAAPAAPAAELEEDFGEDPAVAAPTPEAPAEEIRTRKNDVRTRKDQAAQQVKPKIVPTDDFIRDAKGVVRKDEDGDEMRYAAGEHQAVGYVNENGVLFPNGFKFRGGHVANGTAVLNTCPRCGNRQSIDEALSGNCANLKAGPERQKCGYSQHAELAEAHPDDLE